MLNFARLPTFHFVAADGSETSLDLRKTAGTVRAVAAKIRLAAEPGSVVGLMYPSSADLVVNWLACLEAGVRPLVMQYPTKKQSRNYWADSVRNTVEVTQLKAVLADDYCISLGLPDLVPTIAQRDLAGLPPVGDENLVIREYAIVQLSSGTTGFRKAVNFSSAALRKHVQDYNVSLRLTGSDKIASWLPLYHDMGYVACFVMPLMVGIDVVMMDPMTWVARPDMLFETIARHRATICYMPNFGFEVMSRATKADLSSMRWWISCSEPVSPKTSEKFIAATGVPADTFAPCYAMAENIFAVSIKRGVKTAEIDGVSVISCGKPINNVAIKIVEGEIWAKSPTSLRAYIGGQEICDSEGFYPTGDLGQIIDGELFVTGRKQDLLIQAGRKYMLSDIDLTLNQILPEVRGRGVAVQVYDERLGTQKPVVLIEAQDFYLRTDAADVAGQIKEVMGLDQIEVDFVPPRFLTKTSSGKFNRKRSAADWVAMRNRSTGNGGSSDPVAELNASFKSVARDKPVKDVLDSLSVTVLRILLNEAGVKFDPLRTLAQYEELLRSAGGKTADAPEQIRIVSIADRRIFRDLTPNALKRLGQILGAPVSFEHICLPPSPIVLSDLIFCDYFLPRLADKSAFSMVEKTMEKLKDASIIIADDVYEMFFPPNQVYGALSHNMERDPRADLVCVRWQRYPQRHMELPVTVVAGADLPIADRSKSLKMLSDYLKRPLFRIATIRGFAPYTADWEYRPLGGVSGAPGGIEYLHAGRLLRALIDWVGKLPEPLHKSNAPIVEPLELSDLAHFCSRFVDQAAIEKILQKYDRFCIVGQESSVPYVTRRCAELGKSLVRAPSYAPEILSSLPEKFDCIIICGSMGKYRIAHPAVALMPAQPGWTTINIDDQDLAKTHFVVPHERAPQSGTDWFYPLTMARGKNSEDIYAVRAVGAEIVKEIKEKQAERLAARAARLASRAESAAVAVKDAS